MDEKPRLPLLHYLALLAAAACIRGCGDCLSSIPLRIS